MICAGTYSKFSKALLNMDPLLSGCERHADAGCRLLRDRVLESASLRPRSLPAPSDALELANRLLELRCAGADAGERVLVRAQYAAAVRELRLRVVASVVEARTAVARLGLADAELAAAYADCAPRPVAVALECGRSQRHTMVMGCLLAMMLADAEGACRPRRAPAASADPNPAADDETQAAGPAPQLLLFASRPRAVPVPPADGGAEERLGALLDDAIEEQGRGGAGADYGAMLAELGGAAWSGRDVIVCSDFLDSDKWAAAVRAWRQSAKSDAGREAGPAHECSDGQVPADRRVLSCWRMVAPQAARGRRPQWDAGRPRVDVAFCLDTTGSMGHCIEGCKQQVGCPAAPARPLSPGGRPCACRLSRG